jgi:hypothetical protein
MQYTVVKSKWIGLVRYILFPNYLSSGTDHQNLSMPNYMDNILSPFNPFE